LPKALPLVSTAITSLVTVAEQTTTVLRNCGGKFSFILAVSATDVEIQALKPRLE
jgi:hypothetical protein